MARRTMANRTAARTHTKRRSGAARRKRNKANEEADMGKRIKTTMDDLGTAFGGGESPATERTALDGYPAIADAVSGAGAEVYAISPGDGREYVGAGYTSGGEEYPNAVGRALAAGDIIDLDSPPADGEDMPLAYPNAVCGVIRGADGRFKGTTCKG